MNKYLYLLLAVLAVSCKQPEVPIEDKPDPTPIVPECKFEESSPVVYDFKGETKDFRLSSNVEWTVVCDAPGAEWTKKSDSSFSLRLPKWTGLAERTVLVKLMSIDNELLASTTVEQSSAIEDYSGNITFHEDGSAELVTDFDNQSAKFKLKGECKLGQYKFKIRSVNLRKGYFHLDGRKNISKQANIAYQIRIGNNLTNNYSTAGVYIRPRTSDDKDPREIFNANGRDGVFESASNPSPIALRPGMEINCHLGAYLPKDGGRARFFHQAFINDELVSDIWDARECPWFVGSEMPGMDVWFGLTDAVGTMVIESVDFEEDLDHYYEQPASSSKLLFYERFEQGSSKPDALVWRPCKKGSAGWQVNLSETGDNVWVEDGHLVLSTRIKNNRVESAGISTEGNHWYRNCRVEARLKFEDSPKYCGYAMWFMPQWQFAKYAGWPNGGEIDVFEHTWYDVKQVRCTLHSKYEDSRIGSGWCNWVGPDRGYKPGEYNIFTAELRQNELSVFINGTKIFTYTNKNLPNEAEEQQWPFDIPYYLIFSMGGNEAEDAPKSDFPFFMYVDWLKVSAL